MVVIAIAINYLMFFFFARMEDVFSMGNPSSTFYLSHKDSCTK